MSVTVCPQEPLIPPYLEPATTLAVAVLAEGGDVIEANQGFRRLLADLSALTENAAALFQNPPFDGLVATSGSGLLYHGILNFGSADGVCRSYTGSVHRIDGRLLLVAEADIAHLERMGETVLQLNEEMAQLQRTLVNTIKTLQSEAELEELTLTDPLTGLANRRSMLQHLEHEIERARRMREPLSLVFADIDRFKRVNDNFGHAAGDIVLRAFSHLLREGIRPFDLAARLGGEEFVLVLAECSHDYALVLAERLRRRLQCQAMPPAGVITASFGVASLRGSEDGEQLLERADQALYRAKQEGRNRVVSANALIPGGS